jgi:hypothetical protein
MAWQQQEQQTSSTMSRESNSTSSIERSRGISDEVYFLICQSCFWCASYLNMCRLLPIDKCPNCYNNKIELMPISQHEIYKSNYNLTSRVTHIVGDTIGSRTKGED